jgi:hypothetical protein
MLQIAAAVFACLLFLAAGLAGLILRRHLPERHRDRDTLAIRLAVGALVTFLAIVLGLLTASSKTHFDNVSNNYRHLATAIVQLDSQFGEIGDAAAPVRAELRAYLAAVIASTAEGASTIRGIHSRPRPGQAESVPPLSAATSRRRRVHALQPTATVSPG